MNEQLNELSLEKKKKKTEAKALKATQRTRQLKMSKVEAE